MKKLLFGLLWLLPLMAMAQSPLDGTWKVDLNKAQLPKKPDVFEVGNGMYRCQTCVPKVEIKADGQDHPITGHPYYDTMSVTVVDDHTIQETEMRNGKVVFTGKSTVSSDGKTLAVDWVDSGQPTGEPVTGTSTFTRVGKAPAGMNAVSGSWRAKKMSGSDNGLILTFKGKGDMLSMSTPTGQSYTAKIGGGDAPYQGDPGTTSVSLKQLSNDTVEETDKRDGKVIAVVKMTVLPDGKTMNVAIDDILHGTTSKFVLTKQ